MSDPAAMARLRPVPLMPDEAAREAAAFGPPCPHTSPGSLLGIRIHATRPAWGARDRTGPPPGAPAPRRDHDRRHAG